MKRRALLSTTLALAATLTLSACGFQLRGYQDTTLPFSTLTVNSSDGGGTRDLAYQAVTRALKNADVTLDATAPLRLNLGKSSFDEHELTFGDAGSQERQVVFTLPYSVQRTRDGAYLEDQQSVETSGTYTTSEDRLLSRDSQRSDLEDDLRREAAQQLIERLQTLKPNAQRLESVETGKSDASGTDQPQADNESLSQ
ncbi:LPS assembly lipoprotein LptE [Larsenimonas salina]|uniref:LPS-assembly lipoprotein LptE n=1 Tax=Larsenimonas salina TaxID=1295565 RepID=UPI0020731AAE|nr:LPS assembly lipoprotein LptE [Larsenimonas salina]MCM5703029.1 hypothetical protein [Larsenimonas salina]